MKQHAPATERNREPIAAVLAATIPSDARVVEIASGTGEHAVFLAERLPITSWQPTDRDPNNIASIEAWRADARSTRVLPALVLDVHEEPWPVETADVVVCINMIHIAPWSACEALMIGAARVLEPGGVLYMYGPFKRDGAHTAPSNEAFDRSLRSRDPAWGVRDLAQVTLAAQHAGLELERWVEMPANNLSVIFRKS